MTHTTNEELDRARDALISAGCDFALLSSLANVTYVSGFEVPVPVGALAELTYAPPLALCSASEATSWLVVGNADEGAAQTQSRLDELLSFDTFDSFEPTDPKASFLETIRTALRNAGLTDSLGTLGIEARTMPHAVSNLLATEFPKLILVDVAEAMQQARLIKTKREIALLRRASHIVDIGHITLAELVQEAGRTEFEMWAEIRSRMNQAVGHEIPVTGELVTGPRSCTVAYPNGPRPRTTEPGDAALMDISPRVDGYWSDCTNTHVIGGVEPTATQRKYAKASQAACEAAIAALRPGNHASAAFQASEATFQKHGLPTAHYAGHQIGVVVNELPRLVAYDHTLIEAGMVFSVEPGAYEGTGGTFGARSEKMVLVTPSGPEIMSEFEWGIA